MKEQAGPRVSAFLYGDSMRLILPDKTTIAPTNEQYGISPQEGTSRTNWIDFAVSPVIKVDQLTLRLGSEREAQMEIPLSSKANLTVFQPKTVNPNASTHYDGMTMKYIARI